MSELLANLTYPEAWRALQLVAEKVSDKKGKNLEDLEIAFEQEAAKQGVAIPKADVAQLDWRHHGPQFIEVLRGLLGSDDEFLRNAAQTTVLQVKNQGQAQVFVEATITVGAVIFAIGLLSKMEYSPEKGLTFSKGFPDIEKVPKVVKAFLGGLAPKVDD